MVDVFEEFDRIGTASAALFEYLQDRFDEAEGVLEYVLAGNPGTIGNPVEEVISRLPGSEQGDGITQWVIEYRDAYIGDPAKWVVEPNHVVVVTGPVTITATDSIWINGTVLSLWDALGNAPTLTFAAPEVHVNGLVATASARTIDPEEEYWNEAQGVRGRDGGAIQILSPAWTLDDDACIGTGNGSDGGRAMALAGAIETQAGSDSVQGGAGGNGGNVVALAWPESGALQGTISLGNGGGGGDGSAFDMYLERGVAGGNGGAFGAFRYIDDAPHTPSMPTFSILDGIGGNGGSAIACNAGHITCEDILEMLTVCTAPATNATCWLYGHHGKNDQPPERNGDDAPPVSNGRNGQPRPGLEDGEDAPQGGLNVLPGVSDGKPASAKGGDGGPGVLNGGNGGVAKALGGRGGNGGPGGNGGNGVVYNGCRDNRAAHTFDVGPVYSNRCEICDTGANSPDNCKIFVGSGGGGTPGGNGGNGADGTAIGGNGGASMLSKGGEGASAFAQGGNAGAGGKGGDGGTCGRYAWTDAGFHHEIKGTPGNGAEGGFPGSIAGKAEATNGIGGPGLLEHGHSPPSEPSDEKDGVIPPRVHGSTPDDICIDAGQVYV